MRDVPDEIACVIFNICAITASSPGGDFSFKCSHINCGGTDVSSIIGCIDHAKFLLKQIQEQF